LANKAFDYMMAGVPSLQMDFPEYKKLNDRFNIFILIPDLNPKNIAKAILSIKNYQELNIHNLEAAKEFNWEKEAIVLRKIFKDLGDLNDNVSI
jgi:glycosyltransferase involved in cell wall biosynthesis